MASILSRLTRRRIAQAVSQLLQHLRTPLYANAYALIANQIASAGLGMLYWLVAARLYSDEVVGQNAAIISTLMFLAALAELSLKSAMTRFVPRAGTRTARLIFYTYGISLVSAALIGLVFFLVGNRFQFTAGLLAETHIGAVWLILATMAWCIFYIQDGVLIGMRQAVWVLIENSIYNVAKIVLLIVGVWLFYDYGVAASWFLPTPLLVLLASALIFWRFMPKHIAVTSIQTIPITLRQVVTSVTGDHVGSLLAETCVRMLPLLVLNLLGKSANAHFYQPWMIATLLYLIASNMAYSFTVEAAANVNQIVLYSRRILQHMARLIVPMAGVILVGAPLALGLFGAAYAREGTALLRWLALAALPIILNTWYLNYARVMGDVKSIILYQGLLCVLTLGLSYWWLPTYGITSIGVAWLSSQTLIALLVAGKTAPMLLSRAPHSQAEQTATLNQLWRRADWRFLSSTPQPHKSVCFSDGLLAKSVAAISEQVVDKQLSLDNDCDLAVAVNPGQTTLRAAYGALRAEGVCYTEWAAWRVGGARGVCHRLQAAGFTHVQLYWPYPTPVAPRLWLPLQRYKAPYHYLASLLFAGNGLGHRVARAVLPNVLQLTLRIGLVPHLGAVAYKGSTYTQEVFEFVRTEWSRRCVEPSADTLSFLVQTGGSQLCSKIVYLVFAQSDPDPHWVVKLPRVPEDVRTLQREQNIVDGLHHVNSGAVNTIVLPRMLVSRELNKVWVSGQTALTGVPLNTTLRRDNLRELALQLTDWQVALAKQSQTRPRVVQSRQVIEGLVANSDDLVGRMLEPQILAQTHSILSALDSVPLVCAHNDFAPWNMIRTKDGLGVFDWADADWDGLPMLDLVYALSNLAFTAQDVWDAPRMAATYRMLLDPNTAMGGVFQDCLIYYAEQIGLQSNQIAPLRLLTWVLHSNFEYQNFKMEHGGQVPLGQLYVSVCIPLWEVELQRQSGYTPAKVAV